MFSVLDMFTIGVGPSSSHTVGPMRAAAAFAESLRGVGLLGNIARLRVTLYGSLALTGLGHGTDRAVMAGLEGAHPETVDTDRLLDIRSLVEDSGTLRLAGACSIPFGYETDMVFERWQRMAAHPNAMRFEAFDVDGGVVDEQVWYSIGGGFVRQGRSDDRLIGIHERPEDAEDIAPDAADAEPRDATANTANQDDGAAEFAPEAPHHFHSCDELVAMAAREGKTIARLVWENETACRPAEEVRDYLKRVWTVMRDCIERGCSSTAAILPGGLDVPRRAPGMYARLARNADVLGRDRKRVETALENSDAAWVDLFALAVSEENAGGGRIVTAPTNGAAGIIPAVLGYYWHFVETADEAGVDAFLLTAGAIGYLFKRNASISGAEVGCQGEVGVACSMAAAGLAAAMGGTPGQIENAAEIGIEHHLGLTCDPVGGLVQIPCIERNAMAANTAINAVRMAMLGDGTHVVSLDQAIRTMKQTGEDMMAKYKETSKGGLAVNVVEC